MQTDCYTWISFDGHILWIHWQRRSGIEGLCGDCDGDADNDIWNNDANYRTSPNMFLAYYERL